MQRPTRHDLQVVAVDSLGIMASRTEIDTVVGLAELGDCAGLKKFTPPNFDWASHGTAELPALHSAIVKGFYRRAPHSSCLQAIGWMLENGADPQHTVSMDSDRHGDLYETQEEFDNRLAGARICYKGHSALSLVLALLKHCSESSADLKLEKDFLLGTLSAFSSSQKSRRAKVEVDLSVVQRWADIRSKTATHNVTFETADGPVTAHDIALVAASPVLAAMLQCTMAEGASKRIQVKDSSAAGVELFLDMVYMSATSSDPDYKTVLAALDLSHRWQVHGVVSIFEEILEGMLVSSNFPEIAEAAVLKGLGNLERACANLARTDKAVRALLKKGKLHPAVMKLAGQTAVDDEPAAKKLRTF